MHQNVPRLRRSLLWVVALLAAVGAGVILQGGQSKGLTLADAPIEGVILAPDGDRLTDSAVQAFEAKGLTRLSSAADIQRLPRTPVDLVVLTREGLALSDTDTLKALYDQGTVIAGLNVTLDELQPHLQGTAPGAGRLSREADPARPIFSMIHRIKCGFRAFSDWMDNWPVADLAVHETAARGSLEGAQCAPYEEAIPSSEEEE